MALLASLWLFAQPLSAGPVSTGKLSTVNGWLIRQSARLQSEQELSLSNLGVKIVPRKGGLTYLFATPFSEVQVWNQKTGKCCHVKIGQFHSQMLLAQSLFDAQVLKTVPLRLVKTGSFSGFTTSEYRETEAFAKQQVHSFQLREIPSRSAKTIEYTMTKDLKINPLIYRCITTFYGLPYVGGMPLRFVYDDLDKDRKSHLITGKITACTFTAADFVMPSGLKTVANEQQVSVSETYNEAIDMMMPSEKRKN